jgi:hypothetical protein
MTTKTYRISMVFLLILSATLSSALVFLLQEHDKLTPITSISRSPTPNVCAVPNPRLFAAVALRTEDHSILNG